MSVLEDQIHKAYNDWQNSITVFNNAETNDDIDFAIFNMESKKRQYLRLLHTLKRDDRQEDF